MSGFPHGLVTVAKRKPPTLTLPPTLRFGNRVAQLVSRWLPLFLKGGGNRKYVIARPSEARPWQSQSCETVTCNRKTVAIARL